jgi:hypothetical protein
MPTYRARRFREANRRSPVVYGSVIGEGGKGCFYRLADEQTFELNAEECRAIGHPRWAFEEECCSV